MNIELSKTPWPGALLQKKQKETPQGQFIHVH